MVKVKYDSTAEIKIPKQLVDQVIGQNEAVEVIKKAAQQRRHVLLIGEPGTGKSMLGLALAELLPMEKLVDIIAFPNPNDENMPLIRTVPAGQGRDLVAKAKLQNMTMFKNQNIVMFILLMIGFVLPWWAWTYYSKYGSVVAAIMTASSLIVLILFFIGISMSFVISKRTESKIKVPRIIVDNYRKKQASFNDATGAHAGALLGDVLHDPFQCFSSILKINKIEDGKIELVQIKKELDNLFNRYKNKIHKKQKGNYEALHLPKNQLIVIGETNGSIAPVEVLSCNRQDYNGTIIKLTTSANKELIVTPEHKIAVWQNNRIAYVESKNVKEGDEAVSKAKDVIIDEQDIINTYPQEQQQLAKSYYQYLELKEQNPSWGYKRIATKLGVSYGRTRWWWEKNSAPVPVQTINYLKNKGLLSLKVDNPKLPLIAKVLGSTFGDGGIFEYLNGVFLSSSEREAVEEFGNDLIKIFGKDVESNHRIIEGGIKGHSWCYQNTNRNIIRLFKALGAPIGNKSNMKLIAPQWIRLNNVFEDEFYGSIFGGEIGVSSSTLCGARIEFGITGSDKFNRYTFLNQIVDYLNRRGIETTKKIYSYKRKTNYDSKIFRFVLSQRFENSQKFANNIQINYCKYKKEKLINAINEFRALKKDKYDELISRGYGAENVMKLLQLTPKSLYIVLNGGSIE